MDIASFIRHVPDYPKPGILFYDITPLLASPEAFGDVIERMADAARPLRPTCIAAAEARGFLFAVPLAQRLGVPASIIRSDEQVAAIRQQREQAAAAQQQADMEARMMESMAKVGNVRTQGTVAGEVMGRPQEDDA